MYKKKETPKDTMMREKKRTVSEQSTSTGSQEFLSAGALAKAWRDLEAAVNGLLREVDGNYNNKTRVLTITDRQANEKISQALEPFTKESEGTYKFAAVTPRKLPELIDAVQNLPAQLRESPSPS